MVEHSTLSFGIKPDNFIPKYSLENLKTDRISPNLKTKNPQLRKFSFKKIDIFTFIF
jgi:hypothetical protein